MQKCGGYSLNEIVFYKGEEGRIVGKTYGHAIDRWFGRTYDLRIQRQTYIEELKGIPEIDLRLHSPIDYENYATLSMFPISRGPELVKND